MPSIMRTVMHTVIFFGALVVAGVCIAAAVDTVDGRTVAINIKPIESEFDDPKSPGRNSSFNCIPSGQRYDNNVDGHCGAHARKEQRREKKKAQTTRRSARQRRGLPMLSDPVPPHHHHFFHKNQFKGPPEKPAAPSSGTKFVPTQTTAEVGAPVQKVREYLAFAA